jgi:hypothetical protein
MSCWWWWWQKTRGCVLNLRAGERDNFVKLNINAKGGRRKFMNGTRSHRPSAYGRRVNFGKKFKRYTGSAAAGGIGEMEGNETVEPSEDLAADQQSNPKTRKNSKTSASHPLKFGCSSLWVDEGWLDETPWCESKTTTTSPCLAELQQNVTDDDESLKEAVSKALQNPCEKNLLSVLLPVFGLSSFRKGQMAAIERVLSFQNTMLSLPTGAGKSLCYQVFSLPLSAFSPHLSSIFQLKL